MKLQPGMVVMTYNDCGTNTVQNRQALLIERVRFETPDGYPPDRFGYWLVAYLNEQDEPLNDRSWIIDEHAPPEVLFAPPQDFDPDDYRTGSGPMVWTFRTGAHDEDN